MNWEPPQQRYRSPERGSVLILSIFILLFIGFLAGSLVLVEFKRDQLKNDYASKVEAYYGAEGGVAYAAELIENAFLEARGGTPGSLTDFRTFLDSNSTFTLPDGKWRPVPLNSFLLSGAAEDSVQVLRSDAPNHTELRFRSSATVLGHTETIESVYRAEGKPFTGFDFAMLSNNISCIFCHAQINSVGKYSGGPYERVRVASLESLMLRPTSANSNIYGTLYTTGKIMDKSGVLLNDLSATTLKGYSFTDNMINPSSTTQVSLVAAPTGPDGNPLPGYNFYKDYPVASEQQTDGSMPKDFPGIIPDDNANKIVDDNEFDSVAAYANGAVSGFGYVIPKGSSYSGSSLSISQAVELGSKVEGNLILTGTSSEPIRINGRVVVNGDVIIKGVVEGTGSIIARGNIYVPGDITYNDAVEGGARQYGVAANGTQNSLGLAAGENILIGDYLTPKNGSLTSTTSLMNGNSTGGFGFALSEIALFNRREWQKTQQQLPGPGGVMVSNSTYTPGYNPKYYKLGSASPVWIFKSGLYWDNANQTWIGKEHAGDFTQMTSITPPANAVISFLNPPSSWITPTQLKGFWIEDEKARPSGSPFKIDALVYTDNAVFTLARSASKTGGNMVINGALVARDTGILAGTGLEINYDARVKALLNVKDSTEVTLVKTLSIRKSQGGVSN
jgi:hypothetical protein